jgi:hypothetical protein
VRLRFLGPVAAILVTCLAAYLLGRRRHGLSPRGLGNALAAALETVGLGVLFLGANAGLVLILFLVLRAWSGRFLSVYAIDPVTLGAVSLLQALVYRWWRGRD